MFFFHYELFFNECEICRAVKFTSKLFGSALSRRIKATILYATETGKSEQFAKKLNEMFGHAFHSQVSLLLLFVCNLYLIVQVNVILISLTNLIYKVCLVVQKGYLIISKNQLPNNCQKLLYKNKNNLQDVRLIWFCYVGSIVAWTTTT